jgi:hypothetical protein
MPGELLSMGRDYFEIIRIPESFKLKLYVYISMSVYLFVQLYQEVCQKDTLLHAIFFSLASER